MSSENVKALVTHRCANGTVCLKSLVCEDYITQCGNDLTRKNTYSDVRLTGIGAESVEVDDVIEVRQKQSGVFEFIQKIHKGPRTENRLGTWQTGNRVKIPGFEDTFPLDTGDEKQRTHRDDGDLVVVRVKIDDDKVLSCEVVFFVKDMPPPVIQSRLEQRKKRPGR